MASIQLRARDLGITVGSLPTGERNLITDVAGLRVGHCTVADEKHNTGVTVILPCEENPFAHKLPAAAFVLNGFGKTAGLVQVEELGRIESPIALTNTLNVGKVHDAMVEYLLRRCKAEDVPISSVNPIVCECNDAALNTIHERAVGEIEVLAAIESAADVFPLGDVGGGKGMICHGLKGGIGSASRVVEFDGKTYTVGVLVQTNHGLMRDLTIGGKLVGPALSAAVKAAKGGDGSCIAILATDLPLDSRQLRRVARRMGVGLMRLGSYIDHGSGEVFLAFSTANAVGAATPAVHTAAAFNDEFIDPVFRAAAECAEEAVLDSMLSAGTVTGPTGKTAYSLAALWDKTGL
ncbi:MAG: P1 family peptidase [Oscillospiraceae bacterium]|nr:P1 family peptidase [Oscillospiraceae bacterium]